MKLPAMTITRNTHKDVLNDIWVTIELEDGTVFDTRTNASRPLEHGHQYALLVEQALMALWDALGRPE